MPVLALVMILAEVTVIEVSLIVSILLGAPEGESTIARDTVFAAIMITLNGIVGLCLLSGGMRHHETGFQARAATSALAVLGTVAVLALILPNFTLAEPGPVYSTPQLIFVAVVALGLYALFRNCDLSTNSMPGGFPASQHPPCPRPFTPFCRRSFLCLPPALRWWTAEPIGTLIWVLLLLGSAVMMFVSNKPGMDVVALMMIAALPFTGVLTMQETLAGFSDPNIILIAFLFVLGDGLVRTGIARNIGDWINHKAGGWCSRLAWCI